MPAYRHVPRPHQLGDMRVGSQQQGGPWAPGACTRIGRFPKEPWVCSRPCRSGRCGHRGRGELQPTPPGAALS